MQHNPLPGQQHLTNVIDGQRQLDALAGAGDRSSNAELPARMRAQKACN